MSVITPADVLALKLSTRMETALMERVRIGCGAGHQTGKALKARGLTVDSETFPYVDLTPLGWRVWAILVSADMRPLPIGNGSDVLADLIAVPSTVARSTVYLTAARVRRWADGASYVNVSHARSMATDLERRADGLADPAYVTRADYCDECGAKVGQGDDQGPSTAHAESCSLFVANVIDAPTVDPMEAALEQARELGREAGRAAGAWAADGNTSVDHARKVLALIEDDGIGGEAEQYLPRFPDLSGEWADELTPVALYERITGEAHADAEERAGMAYETLVGGMMDALAQAWEEGRDETYEATCVAELRAILPDPDPTIRFLNVRYWIEDDGSGGSTQVYRETDDNGSPEPHEDRTETYARADFDGVDDMARAVADDLKRHGTTTNDGAHWWYDVDGSSTVDYGTAEQDEASAHPDGFTDAELEAIDRALKS